MAKSRGRARTRSGAARRPVPTRPTTRPAPPAPVVTAPAGPVGLFSGPELTLPPVGVPYPEILRGETYVWWRSLLGALCGLSLFLLLTSVVSQAFVFLFWATTAADRPYADYSREALAFEHPTGMLAVNLGIATLIPIAWALMTAVHQVRPRWLSSVRPRLRWRYLFVCVGVAVVALNGALLASTAVNEPLVFRAQPGLAGFLVVILLTSPIQAAAEEIFFRGYLMQALGSLVPRPWFGVVVSAVVFALLHGTQNLPLFVDRLAFGLLAGVLVLRTGGLEAGIAAHAVNNVFAYLIAGLTTSISSLKAIKEIGWVDAAFDVGGFALFAVIAYLVSRLLKVRTRVELAGPVAPAAP